MWEPQKGRSWTLGFCYRDDMGRIVHGYLFIEVSGKGIDVVRLRIAHLSNDRIMIPLVL